MSSAASVSDPSVKQELNRGLAWIGLASSLVAALDILALILILKFWIGVEEYGVVTVVTTLFGALELAAEVGLSAAVIQRDDHTPERLSTIFWLNFLLGMAFYVLVFCGAPYMAELHGHAIITSLFRVYAFNLILRAAYSLHQALMKKELRFRELSIIRIIANLADFTVKVIAALAGAGLWCFVLGVLARSLVSGIAVPLCHGWRPRLVFQLRTIGPYLKFGVRASASEILYQLYSNLDYQIVNVYFGAAALGMYRAAYELVLEPIRFVSGVVVGIAFPAFARLRTTMALVIDQYVAFTRQNLIFVLSLVALILVAAEDMLTVIIKPEYAAAAPAARILALVGILRALSHIGPPLLDGLGHPELTLRYQTTAAIVLTLLFWSFADLFGEQLGVTSVALAWGVGYPCAFLFLNVMVFRLLTISPLVYLRRVIGIPLCVAGASLAGLAARWSTTGMTPMWRLMVVGGVLLLAIGVLLMLFQGLSLRRIIRALKQ